MRRVLVLGLTLVCLATPEAALSWSWPVDGAVLRGFTMGSDPYAGGQHRGIDIAATEGDPVRAPAAGEVTFAGFVPSRGRSISILTDDGFAVTLSHLGELSVARGQLIGEGGTVGRAGVSGISDHPEPYVQLGIRDASDPNGYRDPLTFLPSRVDVSASEEPSAAVEPGPVAAAAPDTGAVEASGVAPAHASSTTPESDPNLAPQAVDAGAEASSPVGPATNAEGTPESASVQAEQLPTDAGGAPAPQSGSDGAGTDRQTGQSVTDRATVPVTPPRTSRLTSNAAGVVSSVDRRAETAAGAVEVIVSVGDRSRLHGDDRGRETAVTRRAPVVLDRSGAPVPAGPVVASAAKVATDVIRDDRLRAAPVDGGSPGSRDRGAAIPGMRALVLALAFAVIIALLTTASAVVRRATQSIGMERYSITW